MKEVIEFYNKYDEDNRLKSKTHLLEYLITMKYIKKYLTPNSKILEIGARYPADIRLRLLIWDMI